MHRLLPLMAALIALGLVCLTVVVVQANQRSTMLCQDALTRRQSELRHVNGYWPDSPASIREPIEQDIRRYCG